MDYDASEQELPEPVNVVGTVRTGLIKAAQVRGAPDYPTQNLYPCAQGPQKWVYWLLNNLNLTEGIYVQSDGFISYAPAMVARMRIVKFYVHVYVDGYDDECSYQLILRYTSKDGNVYEQVVPPVGAKYQDVVSFEIPLEHVDLHGWFTCSVDVKLLTPLPSGPAKEEARSNGLESPCMPVLIRGSYLEIKGG